MKIVLSIIILFAYSFSYAQGKYKILYFTNMGEISNTGKMFFRGSIEAQLLQKIHKEKKYDFTQMYYKVYHKNLPHKVEAYDFQSNKLKTTYWFDKNAINFQFRKHGKKNIDCTNTFTKKKTILTKIERCNNQHQKIIAFDDWRWHYSYYYQNSKVYKKEILKNEKVSIYKNATLTSIITYEEPDIYPMHRPKLDDYPWYY
jgi:hypothetical protein